MNICFEDYITLEGVSPEINPKSGLYVNRLPGVTLSMFSALTSEDQDDFLQFWEILYDRAVNNFTNEVGNRLNDKFYVEKVLDSRISGSFIKPFDLNNTEEVEAGVLIKVIKSKYSITEVQTLKIYSLGSPNPKDVTFSIIDNETEEVLYTKVVDLEEGLNTIDIYGEFDSKELRISYNPLEVASYSTTYYRDDLNYLVNRDCNNCYSGSNIEQVNGGGLIVEFNTKCSIEKFICSRLSQFKIPFWYYLGVELMTDALMSRNTNCFTIDSDEARKNLGFYELEFNKRIDPILNNLKIKDDSMCFDCKARVTKHLILP